MRARFVFLAAILIVVGCESETPSASPLPSASASTSVAPSTVPSASSSPPEAWSETGSFNEPGGFSWVLDIAEGASTVVAVGTQFDTPLPNLGPLPPHEGRVWLSEDGVQWEDATPTGMFAGVSLDHVLARPDGDLVVFSAGPTPMAWESSDGETWSAITSPFPVGSFIVSLAEGPQGYLADVAQVAGEQGSDLWFSEDAGTWTVTYTLVNAATIGAGDQGFVAADAGFAIASSDGSTWITASAPPAPTALDALVAPVAGDWYAIESGFTSSGFSSSAPVWFSADGLAWALSGSMPLDSVQLDPSFDCFEYVTSLHGSAPWLVAATVLSGPCSEGGFVRHGTQRASSDGTAWTDLPFAAVVDAQTGTGSAVFATQVISGRLVLGGQSNRAATFWIGP